MLAGTLAFEWESSNPEIVAIEPAADGTATVRAKAAGTARIRLGTGTTSTTFVVTVGGA